MVLRTRETGNSIGQDKTDASGMDQAKRRHALKNHEEQSTFGHVSRALCDP